MDRIYAVIYVWIKKVYTCIYYTCLTLIEIWCENIKTYLWVWEYLIKAKMAKYSFKVYFNNIPEGHRPMWIYTMYSGMSTGKYNKI